MKLLDCFSFTPKTMYVAVFSPSGRISEACVFGPYAKRWQACEKAKELDHTDPSEKDNPAFKGVFEIQFPWGSHVA